MFVGKHTLIKNIFTISITIDHTMLEDGAFYLLCELFCKSLIFELVIVISYYVGTIVYLYCEEW